MVEVVKRDLIQINTEGGPAMPAPAMLMFAILPPNVA
jgi:hypothetical protein